MKFYIAGIGNFAFFAKIVEIIIIFCSHLKKDVAVSETRLLSHKKRKSVKRCDLYRCARNKKVTGGVKKIDTDDDNFTYMQNRPLRVEIPKFACGVRFPT